MASVASQRVSARRLDDPHPANPLILTGPDGWGDVPGFSGPNDVADALVRVSSYAGNVKILDYNEHYIPVPPSFLSNMDKLEEVTLFSDINHQGEW